MALSVIVCDDSKFARKQLIRVLPKSLKENLQEAGNGEEALNIIRNGFGELMFLDLNMPVMDGYEVLKRLRAENRDILVIVLTGDVQKEAEGKILSLGALAFLRKPLNPEKLDEVLKKFGLNEENEELDSTGEQHTFTADKTIPFEDAFREVINVAMGQAAKKMADMINIFINQPVPKVCTMTGQEIYDVLKAWMYDSSNILISNGFVGCSMSGELLVYFSKHDTDLFISLLADEKDKDFSRMGTMIDLSNLLVSTLMNSLCEQLGTSVSRCEPQVVKIDDHIRLMSEQLRDKDLLTISLTYTIPEQDMSYTLMMILTPDSVEPVIKRLSFI